VRFSEYDYYADGNKRNQKDGYYEGDKSPETTYKYDNGRLQTETDAKGNIITYVYDSNVSSIFPSKIFDLCHQNNIMIFKVNFNS